MKCAWNFPFFTPFLSWTVSNIFCWVRKGSFGKGVFQKTPFLEILESLESSQSVRPFYRDSRECRDFRDYRHLSTLFVTTPFSRSRFWFGHSNPGKWCARRSSPKLTSNFTTPLAGKMERDRERESSLHTFAGWLFWPKLVPKWPPVRGCWLEPWNTPPRGHLLEAQMPCRAS